jgi:hypothetical protein
MRLILWLICLIALDPQGAWGSGSTRQPVKASSLPYLGPGADKLSADDYQRVYKNYIQTAILLGYPFFKEKAPACDQALTSIFRGAGLFGYPVPADAQSVQRLSFSAGGLKIETYELAGVIIQVARKSDGALDQLVLVNSSSTKATRRLSGFVKRELLHLDKDPITGLERVRGIPVGYPHPYLTQDGQGLYFRQLRFNGNRTACQPEGFQDNTWVGGFDLSQARCTELQAEAQKVWDQNMSPTDFALQELERMKAAALKSALANGVHEAEAKALVEKHFQMPLTSEINVVGSAMRNLAQCNLLALGRAEMPAKSSAPGGAASGAPAGASGGSGSAQ